MTETTANTPNDPAGPWAIPVRRPLPGDEKPKGGTSFPRKVWNLLVAIKDGLALIFLLLFFVALFALLAGRPNAGLPVSRGALVIDLDGVVSEQPAEIDTVAALSGGKQLKEIRVRDVVHALETAADDQRVTSVVLDLDRFLGGGQVSLAEIGQAIDKVRAKKKPVLAFATAYTTDSYQIAAHASEVWADSIGGVAIAGPGGSRLYYKGLIDRLGVTANIYRVGTFKSAVEPYLRSDQSPEAKEADLAYASVLWENWLTDVKKARPAAKVDAFIADTAGAAWAFARQAAPAAIIPPGAHVAALTPLPVTALRLADGARELLARLGVETIGELMAMPRAPLVRRFGKTIAQRLDQATGALPEPLDPIIPVQPIAVTRRFAEPIATADAIGHWLAGLVDDLAAALARAGVGARSLAFVAARVDSTDQVIRIGLARASREPSHLLRLIARRIEEIDVGYGLDALTLHLVRADPLGPETLGAALAEQQAPDLAPLVDTLANRIGPTRLWRHQPIESDVPERSVAPLPPLDPPATAATRLKRDDVRQLDGRTPDHAWHPRWPRPARLLRRPEPIDHVMAEMPDHAPRRFTWRGRPHRVTHSDGPERITGEWWRRAGERDGVRDYFRVEDEQGHRFWLFRRGDGERAETGDLSWYIHGTFA